MVWWQNGRRREVATNVGGIKLPTRKYTEEHIEYLREISQGRYIDEITKLFNEKFGMNLTESAISTLKARYKLLDYL